MQLPERLSIEFLQGAYAQGALTPRQVMQGIIQRARQTADSNIWIIPPTWDLIEPYLQAAQDVPAEQRQRMPLWGIPFAIKDNIDLAGVPTTAGCPAYAYVPAESAMVVRRLMEAGAIPVGKANLDQFATGLVGTRSPYGECHNALRPDLISGGSSSGSAVSVALGMAAFALGTDTAGSGRVPAALNDLVGFKPPLGSWSTAGVVPACASLDCVTVFAGCLDDALAVDQVARALDPYCAWSRECGGMAGEGIAGVDAGAGMVAGADGLSAGDGGAFPRIIYVPADEPRFYGPFQEEYRACWAAAVSRLRVVAAAQGATVQPLDTAEFSRIASILYDGPWVAERWSDLGGFVSEHAEDVFPVTRTILESGNRPDLTAADMFGAYHTVMQARASSAQLLQDAVLAMPTAGGTFTRDQVREDPIATNSLMGLYTNHCNLCDLAAVAVPAGWCEAGVPFGITLFGAHDAQGMLVRAARAFLQQGTVEVAVCGQHLRGLQLHGQLEQLGAVFMRATETAPGYRLFALPTEPVKPGLLRVAEGGGSLEVETYLLSAAAFGRLAAGTPGPLGFGTVQLADGSLVKGFLVEGAAVLDAAGQVREGVQDITAAKSFRAWFEG